MRACRVHWKLIKHQKVPRVSLAKVPGMTAPRADELATLPEPTSPRSWSRAFDDMREGLRSWRLWTHLGWNDLRSRYRRSFLGAFWITIATATTTAGLG